MNRINQFIYKSRKKYALSILALFLSLFAWSQEPVVQDSTATGFNLGNMDMPNPNSIESKYTYDPLTDRYIYTETVGSFNINYPIILTPEEYQQLIIRENVQSYYILY